MILLLILLGLIGLAVGSFLTVVVARLGEDETVVWGRSHCVHCKKTLRWFELIPALSFIIQGGFCRSCKKTIPRTYLAIELATAALFAAFGWAVLSGAAPMPEFLAWPGAASGEGAAHADGVFSAGENWPVMALAFLYYAFFAASAVAISFYDIARGLVPFVLVWPLAAIGLANKIAGAVFTGDSSSLLLTVAAAAASFLFFWSIWFFSKGRAMGRGDADAALAISLYLGGKAGILSLLFSFWTGSLAGIALIVFGKLGWKSQIPFTPFMFLGAIIAVFAPVSFSL